MDFEKEIELLKYQNKLLQAMVDGDTYPFFMFALNHNLNESQVNGILKILSVFKYRSDELNEKEFEEYSEKNIEDKNFLNELGINIDILYSNELPTLTEFKVHIEKICDHTFEIKHLLLSLKKQNINSEICTYLLNQSEDY